jgi:hypothetical protein
MGILDYHLGLGENLDVTKFWQLEKLVHGVANMDVWQGVAFDLYHLGPPCPMPCGQLPLARFASMERKFWLSFRSFWWEFSNKFNNKKLDKRLLVMDYPFLFRFGPAFGVGRWGFS